MVAVAKISAEHYSNLPDVQMAMYRALNNIVPPPDMLPSIWAEKEIEIGLGNAVPGPIRFNTAPYQRGMIDVIKEPGIRRVSYMTGAQLGKTTIQQCISAYFIAHEPRSQIFMMPSQGDVQTFQETKLKPMLQANPKIAKVMAKPRGRDGVNNSRIISYVGGFLMFAWAGSTRTLRSRSAPITHADEIDNCETTAEGSPLELLTQRSATFGDQRLRTEASTPTLQGFSNIEKSFNEGDQRRFYVPCPHCSEAQPLHWGNVVWNGRKSSSVKDYELDLESEHQADTAGYACESCGVIWYDGERIAAIRNAEKNGGGWRANKPFKGHASFHAPEMLSTFRRMQDIVQSYLDKIASEDIQVFVNVSLGEPFEEAGDQANAHVLHERCTEYPAQVPMGGVYLTAGIDMQMDRLEIEIVAWGEAERSWSVDYRVLWGDPLQGDVWDDLDDVLNELFTHESGARLAISAACLDTGGTTGYTQTAYEYVRSKKNRRIFAIKGVGGWGRAIVEKPQRKQSGKNARKVDLFLVGTDEAKLVVMRRLAIEQRGAPGYCEFPLARDEEYFQQLTAEKMVTRYIKGQPIREWVKPDRARNEALDCRVYAYAALKIMQPSFRRTAERLGLNTLQAKPYRQPEKAHEKTDKKEIDHDVANILAALRKKTNSVSNPIKETEKVTPKRKLGKSRSSWS